MLTKQVLSLVLWAMYSRTKDYGMPHLCPWSLDVFEYDGLCSHCSIKERVSNEASGLTIEQLEAKEVEMDKKRKESLKARAANVLPEKKKQYAETAKANTIAARTYACEICDVVFMNTPALDLTKPPKNTSTWLLAPTQSPNETARTAMRAFPQSPSLRGTSSAQSTLTRLLASATTNTQEDDAAMFVMRPLKNNQSLRSTN